MNIDKEIVARAFAKAGEEPITENEWNEGTNNRVRVVKEFYLAVMLEALSSYDWTSQKKRSRLSLMPNFEYNVVADPEVENISQYYEYVEDSHYPGKGYYLKAEYFTPGKTYYTKTENNLTSYCYMYVLPTDCAKCIELLDGGAYIVEGGFLYTDTENAVLLYVTNYFTGKYIYAEVEEPSADDIDDYYVLEDGVYSKAEGYIMGTTYYVRVDEDYNFYAQPVLDPHLSEYIECKLAASLALKLTGDKDKYQMLFNEAQLIGLDAQKKSSEMARNKSKGNPTWVEQLGLK